jgi:hypothetical protein
MLALPPPPPEECKAGHQLQQHGVPLACVDELAQQQASYQPRAKHHQVGKHGGGLAAGEEAAQQEGEGDHVVAKQRVEDELDACGGRNRQGGWARDTTAAARMMKENRTQKHSDPNC